MRASHFLSYLIQKLSYGGGSCAPTLLSHPRRGNTFEQGSKERLINLLAVEFLPKSNKLSTYTVPSACPSNPNCACKCWLSSVALCSGVKELDFVRPHHATPRQATPYQHVLEAPDPGRNDKSCKLMEKASVFLHEGSYNVKSHRCHQLNVKTLF